MPLVEFTTLLPACVGGLLFLFGMKSILNADKSGRQAEARAQAEAESRSGAPVNEQNPE